MGTKNNPGQFDCYAALAEDEPYFLLKSTDRLAPLLVRLWAMLYEALGGQPAKAAEARACAVQMEVWKRNRASNHASKYDHPKGDNQARDIYIGEAGIDAVFSPLPDLLAHTHGLREPARCLDPKPLAGCTRFHQEVVDPENVGGDTRALPQS